MSIIKNLFTSRRTRENRAEYIRAWRRAPGSPEDLWEAHTALERLEEITRRENVTGTGEELEESEEWLAANALVAETMSYVSWLQEWKIREAVAAGEPAIEP